MFSVKLRTQLFMIESVISNIDKRSLKLGIPVVTQGGVYPVVVTEEVLVDSGGSE